MSRMMLIGAALAATSFMAAAVAEEKPTVPRAERAEIHFADLGGIRDWKADGRNALIVEGRNGAKFRATFIGSCRGLNFAQSIGFVAGSDGDLDKFDSIVVDGHRCAFRSFERLAPTPEG